MNQLSTPTLQAFVSVLLIGIAVGAPKGSENLPDDKEEHLDKEDRDYKLKEGEADVAGLHLVPAIEGGLGQSELFKKLRLLGVKKEKISIVIAPWQAAKSEPDFILCAKIFRQGSTHFSKVNT